MPQSFAASYQHLVFSTKQRAPFLRDKMLRTQLHAYIGSISKQLECAPLIVGGVEDHVHILARFGRTITLADWTKELKRISTAWLKEHATLADFSWQAGYGVFSVSQSNVEAVHEYINRQEEHHRTTTFQDEYRLLLRKHDIEWNEKYVWD